MRLLVLLLLPALLPAQVAKFRVRESAGLRRFNFPVRTTLRTSETGLVLLENGKQIPAQFTPGAGSVEIDFNSSPGPWETIDYRVEKGTAEAGQNPISVTQAGGVFTVRVGAQQYDVPENLGGIFNRATGGPRTYVRADSRGLVVNLKDGSEAQVNKGKGTITKQGPLVAGLRFEDGKNVVEMDFPRSKSWVEVRWTATDRERRITAMTAAVNLLMETQPTLVDFGANDTVYGILRAGQKFTLSAGKNQPGTAQWFVHLNEQVYASGLKTVAEGWAHVMDEKRAIAVAVENFGRTSNDHIQVNVDGSLEIRRSLLAATARTLHFWMHFVAMPVQVGAATSPQAMMSPLVVER